MISSYLIVLGRIELLLSFSPLFVASIPVPLVDFGARQAQPHRELIYLTAGPVRVFDVLLVENFLLLGVHSLHVSLLQ